MKRNDGFLIIICCLIYFGFQGFNYLNLYPDLLDTYLTINTLDNRDLFIASLLLGKKELEDHYRNHRVVPENI